MYATSTPPPPPPKPSSHDVSRLGTPTGNSPRPAPPAPDHPYGGDGLERTRNASSRFLEPAAPVDVASGLIPVPTTTPSGIVRQQEPIPDPGDAWLPKILEDKSKQDLAEILSNPSMLQALTVSPATIHPSLAQTQDTLLSALDENISLAQHLADLETRLTHQRASTQAQLLSAHALERQWRSKQVDMDAALAPFAPNALYARLTQSLQEQEMLCAAMEESFLEGEGTQRGGNNGGDDFGGGLATERETLDWVRRYREARRLCYLRQERKERWNERRVGGWR
ncbi:hypothetical protein F5B22DRAFT_400422 [Xylaria bambusicola]|uniref:uncharacterized protein n=1 Tax=Xylaria bambusicola TaxID=326684 RepID=UPI002008B635|nr:uncharacterized protein F5B22DRAFT_400422 [Xylaria bambusicola]KAI0508516.1 hypothetical protein F5B22DRAFT_400422 [Xylaria bambusicola]